MNKSRPLICLTGVLALVLASSAWAGLSGKPAEDLRKRNEQDQSQEQHGNKDDHGKRGEQRRERGDFRNGGSAGVGVTRNFGPGDFRREHVERRPPRVVSSLPYGYRQHYWNGQPYYFFGGSWYRPYGSSFISIGIPFGLFVETLPGYSSSFWYGGTRYYYADDTYYVYEPERHGYIVSRSPYDDGRDEDHDNAVRDDDIYIYPSRGQSEQQQADDRYECHRWAAKETGYDPIDSDSKATERAGYLRAMTACLSGRGYSVR